MTFVKGNLVNPYQYLAQQLDALPNGFPAAKDGSELRLLEKLFTPDDAALAAELAPHLETVDEIAARTGREPVALRKHLKDLARRGLIEAGRMDGGLGYKLMPFVVGIYEMQLKTIDAELAQLFETYYQQAFGELLRIQPQAQRIIPVGEAVRKSMEVRPYESVAQLVDAVKSWGVVDCICRKQKALIGRPCGHPVDVCMVFSERPGAFDGSSDVRALTRDEALATLRRAAEAGLVHSVSNNQQGIHYVCNCCTCSCGILRGMAELGIANVVARSAFVNRVDPVLCSACGECVSVCPFGALHLEEFSHVDDVRCVGCGVCVLICPNNAMGLVRRPEAEILPVPETLSDWGARRQAARGR
jgi:ferredoxin